MRMQLMLKAEGCLPLHRCVEGIVNCGLWIMEYDRGGNGINIWCTYGTMDWLGLHD